MSLIETFNAVLKKANEVGASDIHISAGGPFRMRVRGGMAPVAGLPPLSPSETREIAGAVLLNAKKATPETLESTLLGLQDLDCSYSVPGVGRFRVNICSQRGSLSTVMRAIAESIPAFEELGLPPVLSEIALEERGLVLLTGTTGSGKSTTLASMVAYVNQSKAGKIVTIEDPIEFLHRDAKCNVVQRELGSDTESFESALRAALRQDPDIILVGEMRDRSTIDIALKAAETGHLVFSTVHTTDAQRTIARLISVFDPSEQMATRLRLSESLRAVISQRLLPKADGTGRAVAVEVMRNTATICECIADPDRTAEIRDFISAGRSQYGMQTFDQHLMELYQSGVLTLEVARGAATSPADFERNLQFQ
ncbi:MAG: type IV pili twitching motility protein PilT [Gemmatimonadetes bacterium HGW-Gemmatimonadetes-1]|nr:MAG: type IV pili twitching motility protein PilT [Gemmatimonadetes bacterium HGW-Gemmatimonadetes-1]